MLNLEDNITPLLEVYPNPVNGNKFSCLFVGSSIPNLKLYDLLGNLLYQTTSTNKIGLIELSILNLKSGTYILSLQSSDLVLSKKVVVVN